MKNLIGGLFPTQESANLAYEALQSAGFPGEEINMFVHRPRKKIARATDVKVQSIARNALVGGCDRRHPWWSCRLSRRQWDHSDARPGTRDGRD